MKTWVHVTWITLLFAIPTFILGPLIWTAALEGPAPTTVQIVLLIIISAIESVAFGLGMAFFFLGWPLVRKLSASRGLAIATHLSITWLLISWWPHDNMHKSNGSDMAGLVAIEYEFHVTLIAAALIVAYFFYQHLRHSHRAMVA